MSPRDLASSSSELHPSEGDLSESELYRTLTELASVGLWHIDETGMTRYANPAMIRMLEVDSLESIAGKPFEDFLTPESMAIVHAERFKREQGLSSSYEIRLVGRSGREIDVVVSGTPLMNGCKLTGMIGSFVEITNLRVAETALRESQAMLRAAMESLPFDFWAIGSDGRYCLQNTVSKARWGDQIGMRPEEVGVPPDMLAIWMENNRRALSGQLVRGEIAYHDGDEMRHIENILAPIRYDSEVRGLLGVNIDITPRKHAEQARRRAHATLQAFFDHSPALVFLKDMIGCYQMINRQFELLFGVPREQILGRTDAELFPEDQAARFARNDQKVLESGAAMEFEEVARYLNGVRTSLVLKFPVRDENGMIVGVGGVATDVTDRLATEEARRRSDERYRVLVERARDVIFTLSPDGLILSVNPACEAVSGWQPNDWVGKEYSALIFEEDRSLAEARFNQVLRGQYPTPYELRALRKDGNVFNVEVTLTPIIENGKFSYALGIARDVTDRRQLEDQLRQSQRMESIGQLAGGVAHDFNNILTVIQGHAALAGSAEGLPREVQENISQITQAAERAANLTRQLLAFGRRQLLQPRPLDLNEIVAEMSKMLRRILGEDILLEVVPTYPLPTVQGDAGMLEQVLMNLAVNSRDAMPGGGRLTLTTEPYRRRFDDPQPPAETSAEQFVRLTVTDTGCGIEAKHIQRIFEPFYTTKGVGRGTGLGLATIYGIVQQHHGWITVESEPGNGTTFRVHLPAEASSGSSIASGSAREIRAAGGHERILVAEDEIAVRCLVRSVLTRLGYEVMEAHSGVEALRLWREHRGSIDLLLTDIVMPGGMNGRQLAETLLGEEPDLLVIYTSGYAAEAVGGTFKFVEGENFIQKPYPPQRLADLVRAMLDTRTRA
ncbi:MAG TPA: PAS domain S-box protein [Chthoniobacteraceae bacterium]|nr:PAS domain S-box protein [Chthoniobacteraceae bacterium]